MRGLRLVRLVAVKDLRVEWRTRSLAAHVVPFVGVLLLLFAFALDVKAARVRTGSGAVTSPVLELVAPGLYWLAVIFSLIVLVRRSFDIEMVDGTLEGLLAAGVSASAIFWGKTVALGVQLLAVEAVVLVGVVLLYNSTIPVAGIVLLVAATCAATLGLACIGIVYGSLMVGGNQYGNVASLLLLPSASPVLIAATRAVESALGTDGATLSAGWPWVGLLTVFAGVFSSVGGSAFGLMIDDSR